VGATRKQCWKYDWVLEFDIKGLFDNIDHELLLRAVRKHIKCRWALLYIERWLKVPMVREDGTKVERSRGTPEGADLGDTVTLDATLSEAGMAVAELVEREAEQRPEEKPKVNLNGIEEVVGDKGYHSGAVLERVKSYEVRTYIPEKKQAGQRHWEGKSEEQQAVYQNRQRVSGGYGKSLLRRRGELVERSFAHCYETGGMRRTYLRGHENILKRQLVHVGEFNLSLILRRVLGAGTPRQWKDLAEAHLSLFIYYLLVGKIAIGSQETEFQYLVRNRSQTHEARSAARRGWSCRQLSTYTPGC
jgi:Transposase DDE domain